MCVLCNCTVSHICVTVMSCCLPIPPFPPPSHSTSWPGGSQSTVLSCCLPTARLRMRRSLYSLYSCKEYVQSHTDSTGLVQRTRLAHVVQLKTYLHFSCPTQLKGILPLPFSLLAGCQRLLCSCCTCKAQVHSQ